MQDLVQDLKYSGRQILRNPAFAITAVLSLALGIGATTAIAHDFQGVVSACAARIRHMSSSRNPPQEEHGSYTEKTVLLNRIRTSGF